MAGDGSGTGDGVLGGRMKLLAAKVDSKILFHKDATKEYMELKHLIGDIAEEKARMEQEAPRRVAAAPPEPVQKQFATVREELAATKAALAARNEELAATKEALGARNEEVAATTEALAATNEELALTKELLVARTGQLAATNRLLAVTTVAREVAKKERDDTYEELKAIVAKAQELEAMKDQAEQQSPTGVAIDSVQYQPSERLAGHHASTDDDLERIRETLIKEFMQIDSGRRVLGVKEMGRLDEKPFHAACAAKLPPKEAKKAASELYTTWEMLLKNPSWKPFKTDADGDNFEDEAIDADDDKLQELKREWGEDAHNAVVSALMEMREYNCLSNRSVSYELWNYKAGRKATAMECIEYMSNQVKLLSASKRR